MERDIGKTGSFKICSPVSSKHWNKPKVVEFWGSTIKYSRNAFQGVQKDAACAVANQASPFRCFYGNAFFVLWCIWPLNTAFVKFFSSESSHSTLFWHLTLWSDFCVATHTITIHHWNLLIHKSFFQLIRYMLHNLKLSTLCLKL